MSVTANGPVEIASLILRHPGMPVLKSGGDGSGDDLDYFVLSLVSAEVGKWWSFNDRIYDDEDDVSQEIESCWDVEGDPETPDEVPHGECIWIRMDYFDPIEEAKAELEEKGETDD